MPLILQIIQNNLLGHLFMLSTLYFCKLFVLYKYKSILGKCYLSLSQERIFTAKKLYYYDIKVNRFITFFKENLVKHEFLETITII